MSDAYNRLSKMSAIFFRASEYASFLSTYVDISPEIDIADDDSLQLRWTRQDINCESVCVHMFEDHDVGVYSQPKTGPGWTETFYDVDGLQEFLDHEEVKKFTLDQTEKPVSVAKTDAGFLQFMRGHKIGDDAE